MKFSTRMVLYYSLTSVVVLLIVGALAIKSIEAYWIKKVDQQLSEQNIAVQDYINQVFLFEKSTDNELNERNAKLVAANLSSGIGQLLIYNNDLLLLSGLVDVFEHPDFNMLDFQNKVLKPAQQGGNITYIQNNIYYTASPIESKGKLIGVLVINYKLDLLNLILNRVVLILCIGAAVFCLIIILMSIFISQRLIRPIKKLVTTTEKYSIREFEIVNIDRNDELGQLSKSINSMGVQLKDHIDRQKQFVSNVSHELRTPLAAIKGYTEYLADEVMGDPSLDKVIYHLNNETARLSNMVNDLLQMSHMDSFKEKYNFEKTDLSGLLSETMEKMRDRAGNREIGFSSDICPDIVVNADKDKLVQVLVNLLDNAIKYSPEKTIIEVSLYTDRNFSIITIADKGMGIPEEDIDKVFDRFYRATNAKGINGTGLGLAICKEIIDKHTGEISLKNVDNGGTQAILTLPLAHCYKIDTTLN